MPDIDRELKPICFMVMPFRIKPVGDPKRPDAPTELNCDALWDKAFRPAIDELGYLGQVRLAMDAAASEFRDGDGYSVGGKWLTPAELIDLYAGLLDNYPIVSIEDPFHEAALVRMNPGERRPEKLPGAIEHRTGVYD